jgi:uncharacterized protein (TIGR02145 family)
MKIIMSKLFFLVSIILLASSISCKKKQNNPTNTETPSNDSTNNSSLATIQTSDPLNISYDFAVVGGDSLKSNNDSIISTGICWNTTSNVNLTNSKSVLGNSLTKFTYKIGGLKANTTYYYRAYITGKQGTGYGKVKTFSTLPLLYSNGNGVKDINGNYYRSIIIGNQEWMIDNLEVTKYNDGSEIPLITNKTDWYNNTKDAYCSYENDLKNKTKYGALYNGYAVLTDKLCPTNWHVPSIQEWDKLIENCGGSNIAGGRLKEVSLDYWAQPNTDASNIAGFTGIGSGFRTNDGSFFNLNKNGYWWSSTDVPNASYTQNFYVTLTYSNPNIYKEGYYKQTGLSVRCVKNQ